MHYLLNKDLSLEEKGFMALTLHLQEGNIKLTGETLKHYCPKEARQARTILILARLYHLGYINIIDEGERITVVEDNEIKE
jgi:hypothetical protein